MTYLEHSLFVFPQKEKKKEEEADENQKNK